MKRLSLSTGEDFSSTNFVRKIYHHYHYVIRETNVVALCVGTYVSWWRNITEL